MAEARAELNSIRQFYDSVAVMAISNRVQNVSLKDIKTNIARTQRMLQNTEAIKNNVDLQQLRLYDRNLKRISEKVEVASKTNVSAVELNRQIKQIIDDNKDPFKNSKPPPADQKNNQIAQPPSWLNQNYNPVQTNSSNINVAVNNTKTPVDPWTVRKDPWGPEPGSRSREPEKDVWETRLHPWGEPSDTMLSNIKAYLSKPHNVTNFTKNPVLEDLNAKVAQSQFRKPVGLVKSGIRTAPDYANLQKIRKLTEQNQRLKQKLTQKTTSIPMQFADGQLNFEKYQASNLVLRQGIKQRDEKLKQIQEVIQKLNQENYILRQKSNFKEFDSANINNNAPVLEDKGLVDWINGFDDENPVEFRPPVQPRPVEPLAPQPANEAFPPLVRYVPFAQGGRQMVQNNQSLYHDTSLLEKHDLVTNKIQADHFLPQKHNDVMRLQTPPQNDRNFGRKIGPNYANNPAINQGQFSYRQASSFVQVPETTYNNNNNYRQDPNRVRNQQKLVASRFTQNNNQPLVRSNFIENTVQRSFDTFTVAESIAGSKASIQQLRPRNSDNEIVRLPPTLRSTNKAILTRNKVAFFKKSLVIVKDDQNYEIAFKRSEISKDFSTIRIILYLNNKRAVEERPQVTYEYDSQVYSISFGERLTRVGPRDQGRQDLTINYKNSGQQPMNFIVCHIKLQKAQFDLLIPALFLEFKEGISRDALNSLDYKSIQVRPDKQFSSPYFMYTLMPLTQANIHEDVQVLKGQRPHQTQAYVFSKYGRHSLKLDWMPDSIKVTGQIRWVNMLANILADVEF